MHDKAHRQGKPPVDLTQTDPDHIDGAFGPPWSRWSSPPLREGIHIDFQSGLMLPAAATLGAAWFMDNILGMNSVASVALGIGVVTAVRMPQLALKLMRQAGVVKKAKKTKR